MQYALRPPLSLLAGSLFSITCLVACRPAPDQLTLVRGTVISATTGRPLPGVLLGIESYSVGLFNTTGYSFTGDSVRTDAQGKYELHFYNKKGLTYAVDFEPRYLVYTNAGGYTPRTSRYVLNGGSDPGTRPLTIGAVNVVDYQPDELRTVAVRIRNRNTGYQRLYFNKRILHGNNLDTLAYLPAYYLSYYNKIFIYSNFTDAGAFVKDTVVVLALQTPGSLPPDTLRATLTFVR